MPRHALRTSFWTPYDEMKGHVGKKIEVLRELTTEEAGEEELKGQLFRIRLEDGTEINAWYEEIHENSCVVGSTIY